MCNLNAVVPGIYVSTNKYKSEITNHKVGVYHTHTYAYTQEDVYMRFTMCSVRERGGVARSTRLCADSGNRVEMAAAA